MQYQRAADGPRDPDSVLIREAGPASSGTNFSLAHVLGVLKKRKWLIAGFVVAAVLLGLVITLLMTPQYTSSAVVEIQRETRNFTNVDGVDSKTSSTVDPEFYETQAGLLRSVALAGSVATDARLQDNAQFFEMFGSRKAKSWFDDQRLIPGASTRDERVREASDILLDHLRISIQRQSRLATISFTSPDVAFSKRIVDSWASHFVQATLDRRYAATAYARKFLEDRLGQLRTRIDQAERQLVDYAAQQGIVNLPSEAPTQPGASAPPERSLVAEDLVILNKELATATAQRIAAQSRLGASGGDVEEALDNTAISQMRARRADLAAQYADMMQRFDPAYRPAMAIKAQLDTLDRSIAREEGRVRSTLQETYQAAQQREAALVSRVDKLKSNLFDLRRRSTQYNILMREVDTNRQLYDALLQRYKEIGVAGGVGVNNIAVVDAGDLPDKPSSPRLWLNLAFALLGGLLAGVALAFALDQLEDSLSDPAEVPELLRIPLIGVVPKISEEPLAAMRDSKSALNEAYFSVQTSLALATTHGFPRALVVTSSRPNEGKSLTSFALAKTLAARGRKVVLVDGDMRSPSIHHMLGLNQLPGFSTILTGGATVQDAAQATDIANLSIIAAGTTPPSAAELLAGTQFASILEKLLETFDHVIIDAPPVMGFADAPLIANNVEGVCFVIEAHGTNKSSARTAIARLRNGDTTIFGAVVTKFDSKRAFTGYGYDYGYGYGYGESATSGSAR
ncbi:polysaccharide biosynthesis tyrosine autokinase [Sphingomonas sp. BGYR3]|uniref:GumC family protein n=1 Tax=Sphingomonas sp. BGYR3 TaxID=2975483 RepID=UPI0021A89870|nr:polysaccharide biosynthesis tyrosine autokinase [Sphingomonas sp. BGYR3]MDG5488539.1 polysaccharide biosynthesis tyrosine autokinase [Sphingomonas sp. BGYR3]